MESPLTSHRIGLHEAASRSWQVVVVGAGPAGSLAARELADRGAAVLLVDRATFPRPKVCGGCLGAAALSLLSDCRLGRLVERLGALRTERFELHAFGRRHDWRLPPGAAVSRAAFDAGLRDEAMASGVRVLDGTAARLGRVEGSGRVVSLRRGPDAVTVRAPLVLAADGLSGGLLARQPELASSVARHSRIGVGACGVDAGGDFPPGVVTMIYARGGYLGLVRVEGGQLNAAGAFDADYLRAAGGPSAAACLHLSRANLPWPESLARADWLGTPALTRRRRRLAAPRLLVLGDAAGYIEPFTGEGMTWALASALAVVPPAMRAVEQWSPAVGREWEDCYTRLLARRTWVCRALAAVLRRPPAASAVLRLLSAFPWLAQPAIRHVSRPLHMDARQTRLAAACPRDRTGTAPSRTKG